MFKICENFRRTILDYYQKLFITKFRILVLGLNNSSKSTTINSIFNNCHLYLQSKEKVIMRSYVFKNINFKMYEIKGDRKYRNKWDKYYRKCDVLLFCVDLAAREEVWEECRFELQQLIKRNSRTLKNMLILGTKNDKENAVECKDVIFKLGLLNLPDLEIACFSISAVKNINTGLILPWIFEQYKIKNSKEKLKLF